VAINKRRERNHVSYDNLNNLSYVDLFYDKKARKTFKENLRNLPGRAVDSKKRGRRCK
jgi:hypothetical protein